MFVPSPKILNNYADVLIKFALNSGNGIKKGEVVYLVTQIASLPLARAVYSSILKNGGQPIVSVIDDQLKLIQLKEASDDQIAYFPKPYYSGLAQNIDHWVRLLGEDDPLYLKSADPRKIMLANKSAKPFREMLDKKEDAGKFTWTLCLYGTPGMAKEAGLSIEQYWKQIENACYLNDKNPIKRWQSVFTGIQTIIETLNDMPIDKLHVQAPHTDLWITLGQKRRWLGGSGRNIPSFEIFTSPDWRGTEGTIAFDQPLYRYGNIIKDISLEFKKGLIVKAKAKQSEKLLHAMIKQKNADKIGEYSLTDTRFSKITHFMANTLYDENFGGKYGNTHLAVGKSYHDTYAGNMKTMKEADYEKLGFNASVEHTDIIATTDRVVTAVLKDGSVKKIYEGGEFVI